MKKIMFLLILLVFPVMVYAEDYSVKTLIPVDTKATVKTDKFDYNNFSYNSSVDDKGNSLITFESIKNNTVSKLPISINILLFDSNQKNIGFVTYCTDKDLSSNYSGYKLTGNSSAPFSIKVVSKYFVEGKTSKDVKYISVLDENKYCHIGGYDKYKDLTIDEIVNGVNSNDKKNGITKLITEMQENGLGSIIIIVLIGIAVLVIIIMVLSSILKKIKSNQTVKASQKVDITPMEETVDLSYKEVDNETLDDDAPVDNVSMGEVNNTIVVDEEEKKEEDEDDLTKFFK